MAETKRCQVCDSRKPLDDFETTKKGSLRSQCKECRKQLRKKTKVERAKLAKPDIKSIVCKVCNIDKNVDEYTYKKEYNTYSKKCKACRNLSIRRKHEANKINPPVKPNIDRKICKGCNVDKDISEYVYVVASNTSVLEYSQIFQNDVVYECISQDAFINRATPATYENKCKRCRYGSKREPQDVNTMMNKALAFARKTNESIENYYNKHMKQYE